MSRRKRTAFTDKEKDINFDLIEEAREETTLSKIINGGEEEARELLGDDAVDNILISNHLANRYHK